MKDVPQKVFPWADLAHPLALWVLLCGARGIGEPHASTMQLCVDCGRKLRNSTSFFREMIIHRGTVVPKF